MPKKMFIEINGETKSVVEWAIISGISEHTIKTRYRNGIRGTDLIKKTSGRGSEPTVTVNIDGKNYTISELSEMYGLPRDALYRRRSEGKTGKELIKPIKHSDEGWKSFVHRLWHGKWVYVGNDSKGILNANQKS